MKTLYLIPVWLFLLSLCNGKSVQPQKCGVDEYFDHCGGRNCEPTCEDPERACLGRACFGPPECVCESGYYRDKFGNCVLLDECDDMEIITFAPETRK
ncbi:hypothetical protein Y032_0112g297 [Ancylostoma ceylanicum]|uniref:TIL domain-containing protein n=1 Tax=Ancylostoma ceylanicum TaxID=53326 RepID=A0A016TDR8_9BILA|nr:hypothetical protein Y032_0112g297 [Ancylostoma ceylanicum]